MNKYETAFRSHLLLLSSLQNLTHATVQVHSDSLKISPWPHVKFVLHIARQLAPNDNVIPFHKVSSKKCLTEASVYQKNPLGFFPQPIQVWFIHCILRTHYVL